MKKTRTYIAVMAMAASVSLLAACSNEDDSTAPAETTPPPATSPAPGAGTAPDTGAPTTPAPSSSMSDTDSSTTDSIAAAGNELQEDAAQVAESARQAVADGAAKADAAIQDKVGNGSTSSN